jgi:hypothetical protein
VHLSLQSWKQIQGVLGFFRVLLDSVSSSSHMRVVASWLF